MGILCALAGRLLGQPHVLPHRVVYFEAILKRNKIHIMNAIEFSFIFGASYMPTEKKYEL